MEHNAYVQIKKLGKSDEEDENKLKCLVLNKIEEETKEEEIVTLDKKDLKKFIKVKVGLFSSNNYADESNSATEYSILKVKIGDKVDKIFTLISSGKSGEI